MIREIYFNWHSIYKCNYRCPYCFYNGSWQVLPRLKEELTIENWVMAWHRIYEKYGSVAIGITGGEPLLYPAFAKLIKEISRYHNISIVTNLSWSLKNLIDFANQIDSIKVKMTPSFHPSFTETKSFLEKALFLKKKGISERVFYVTYPPQLELMKYFKKEFEQNGLRFVAVPFRGEYQGTNYPEGYTEEEVRLINDSSSSLESEEKRWVDDQTSLKRTKGRLCRAGQIYAHVDVYGQVYRCSRSSQNSKPIGDLFDIDFRLLDKALPCEMETCPCEYRSLAEENGFANRRRIEDSISKKADNQKYTLKVKYRRFGKTELKVSEIGIGGHEYNLKGGLTRHSLEERIKIMSKALDLGVNYFDACDKDELSSIVRILKRLNARDECIIAYGENVEGFRIINADEKHIRELVEGQLKILQTDRIDIFRILDFSISDYAMKMNVSIEKELEEISFIIDKLKKEGKVRFSCYTTHSQDVIERYAGKADIGNLFDTIQIRFNFFECGPINKIIPYAKTHDMGLIVMKPFRKGTLLNKYCGDSSDSTYADLKLSSDPIFENLKYKEKGLAYALLKYILSNQDICTVIPGVASIEEVVENANVSIFG